MTSIWVNGAPQRKVLLGTSYGLSYWGVWVIFVSRVIISNSVYSMYLGYLIMCMPMYYMYVYVKYSIHYLGIITSQKC